MIEVESIGIRFRRNAHAKREARRLFLRPARGSDTFWALRGVSLHVGRGEAVGLVGRNGQGKSTLLRLIAGVLIPDEGRVRVDGGVAPLIEITGGFLNELSVRDNVFLTAGLHGQSRATVAERLEGILDFAELRGFSDTPYRHLSSGMKARLAFSVVSSLDEPILLVDEVLAVGDKVFREKCYQRIGDMLDTGRTMIIVSHREADLRRFCRRGLLLHHGELRLDGPIEDVLAGYDEIARSDAPSPPRLGAPVHRKFT